MQKHVPPVEQELPRRIYVVSPQGAIECREFFATKSRCGIMIGTLEAAGNRVCGTMDMATVESDAFINDTAVTARLMIDVQKVATDLDDEGQCNNEGPTDAQLDMIATGAGFWRDVARAREYERMER